MKTAIFPVVVALLFSTVSASASAETDINKATLAEAGQATPEVSTAQLRQVLEDGSAVVFDARPYMEYVTSHIPGAVNVAPKPGVELSVYVSDVAEVGRLLKGDKSKTLVIYCNGPHCGKAKRFGEELLKAGYTDVRRYQLGMPVWRALGGVGQIKADALKYVAGGDATAVFIDARNPNQFSAGSAPKAVNLPFERVQAGKNVGELRAAKNDGRLPMMDHNTRIIVFGATGEQARVVAEEIAEEAFHNVAFFDGEASELIRLTVP